MALSGIFRQVSALARPRVRDADGERHDPGDAACGGVSPRRTRASSAR